MRRSVEETWQHLEPQGYDMPPGPRRLPPSVPNFDDDLLWFFFFRTLLEDNDLSGLSLPRTYFGRSGFTRVSFADSDLSESRMCRNDFVDCDFTGANLSGCDMRSSIFRGCTFAGAVLHGADLRRSAFEGCRFIGADLSGAVATVMDWCNSLTPEQRQTLSFTEDDGPEPPGG